MEPLPPPLLRCCESFVVRKKSCSQKGCTSASVHEPCSCKHTCSWCRTLSREEESYLPQIDDLHLFQVFELFAVTPVASKHHVNRGTFLFSPLASPHIFDGFVVNAVSATSPFLGPKQKLHGYVTRARLQGGRLLVVVELQPSASNEPEK